MTTAFIEDLENIRERVAERIEDGAVTPGYQLDRKKVIELLNQALATEIVCMLRYKRHAFMADGVDGQTAAQELFEHADEEQRHADMLAQRIVQLGGMPDFAPQGLTSRSHASYVPGDGLEDMLREDLIAERIAIECYRKLITYVGDRDPTTRRMLEEILASEEEHADEIADMLRNTRSR